MPYTDLVPSVPSDRPSHSEQEAGSRTGRPSHPPRQSSYSKRHASFDTPREVPFSSQPSSLRLQPSLSPSNSRRTSFSRSSSCSTVTPFSGLQLSPTNTQATLPSGSNPLQQDHGKLAATLGQNSADVGGFPSPTSTADGPFPSTGGMTYNHSPEANASSGGRNTSGAGPNYSQQNSGGWDSEQLRPQLLSLSRRKSRDLVPQSDRNETAKAHHSPYMTDNHGAGEDHSLNASSSSLPLPSQTPVTLLSSPASSHQGTRLARVVEQVQLDFSAAANGSRSGSDSDSPFSNPPVSPDEMANIRRYSSPRLNDPVSLFESTDKNSRSYTRLSTSTTGSTSTSVSTSSRSSTASSCISPPTPPQVHTPPAQFDGAGYFQKEGPSDAKEENRKSAPYEPFLSHAPPPADAHIHVESTDQEYRLIVKLPGYKRDAMYVFLSLFHVFTIDLCLSSMLTTRRRRVLHIAADKWEAGGGTKSGPCVFLGDY